MEAKSTFGKGVFVVFPGSTFSLSSESTIRSQEGKPKTVHSLMTEIVKHYYLKRATSFNGTGLYQNNFDSLNNIVIMSIYHRIRPK